MPFVYGVVPTIATFLATGTANTENPNIVLRQATRGFDLKSIFVCGKGAAQTTLNGIAWRVRRWTTAGTGGTAITPQPRRVGTTASTTAASSESAITAGTVSGAYQLAFGCGGTSPGGWVAPDIDSTIHVEGGSADELDINSMSTTATLPVEVSCEISE